MNSPCSPGTLQVPTREIPLPPHLSPEAKGQMSGPSLSNPPWPAQHDIDGWRQIIAAMDAMGEQGLGALAQGVRANVTTLDLDGVTVYDIIPEGVAADDRAIYLDIHGGALL